ncbi:mannose-P-dolichol utilization defect 1 protein [Oryzias latipes]|uniref:mannose-P-dolichol utilization defect 1 protein n=1 Tax=Oryzias latipes TaxID=8090 RepID=UPI000CE1B32A|nr:mannose-P-dolichol utilization defect 1 protein [Oryzias latipes]
MTPGEHMSPSPSLLRIIPSYTGAKMAMSLVRNLLVGNLMPEKCYEQIFLTGNVHVPCLKFVLNRIAGFWIILDTFLAQTPQLLKILWRGSAEGLSVASFLLQLYALSCPVVYAVAHNFPFFAWAERLFTLSQTAAILFLIMHHQGLLLLLVFGGVMLLLARCAATAVVSLMQASNLAAVNASKVFQTITNHQNGHTGQLSTLSVFLTWTGSLGLIVVSLQESGSSFTSLLHILSSGLSFVLLLQVCCSKSSTAAAAAAKKNKKTD